jgi:hypothetical protein
MIYFNSNAFWGYIARTCLLNKPNKIYISTYNIITAINNYNNRRTGTPIPGKPQKMNNNQIVIDYCDMISSTNRKNSCIIIGENTIYDKEKHRIKEVWPNINIYYKNNNHAKVVIMSFKDNIEAWIGSMNFNDSKWSDVMVKLVDNNDIKKLIENLMIWKKSSTKLK